MQEREMRELLLKNRISSDRKRKDILLLESYERGGCLQRLEKRLTYAVKDIVRINDDFDLEAYLDQKRKEGQLEPRHTHIIKSRNSKASKDEFTYKVSGDIYTVSGDKLYLINLNQCLKLELSRIAK